MPEQGSTPLTAYEISKLQLASRATEFFRTPHEQWVAEAEEAGYHVVTPLSDSGDQSRSKMWRVANSALAVTVKGTFRILDMMDGIKAVRADRDAQRILDGGVDRLSQPAEEPDPHWWNMPAYAVGLGGMVIKSLYEDMLDQHKERRSDG